MKKRDSEDSEEDDNDNKPIEEKANNSRDVLFTTDYGPKNLSVVRRKKTSYSELKVNDCNSDSDTECTSETCASETNFQLDTVVTSTQKRRGKSKEHLQRRNNAKNNSYWITK